MWKSLQYYPLPSITNSCILKFQQIPRRCMKWENKLISFIQNTQFIRNIDNVQTIMRMLHKMRDYLRSVNL
ncbi:hypothetical protein FGO68_gene11532 [Halteria grandinella]|uniref:Uncharacterized protein n=1 Tax=Halteria grandinella TaxID=5974 RepID=A0A8J8P5C6_HALGN|nr:hypothetical protein FGO68_gene11532 [Halteria grandinella]